MLVEPETIIVTIEQGKLRGRIAQDYNGNPYKSFQGIPYAKPPVGKLRFLPPQPPEPWTEDILDATKERDVCYSPDLLSPNFIGSEDCLFLNVYTPKLPDELTESKLPVMVWIHGGGFYIGSGNTDLYGPEFLITKDVVLVTLNYRLGYLGFLSLKNSKLGATGNAGLKDQVQALRWVQKNIHKFGGDADNVTIFGESAGGASVHLLTLSPLSNGLFHRAIIQSGSGLAPWAIQPRRDYEFAKSLGCTSESDDDILEFLQKQKVEDILKMQQDSFPVNLRAAGELLMVPPAIEPDVPGAFISEPADKIMCEGRFHQIPIMIGLTDKEGHIMTTSLFPSIVTPDFTDNKVLLPRDLINRLRDENKILKVGEEIKKFYYGDKIPSKELLEPFMDYATDVAFAHKIQMTTRMIAENSSAPVYNYLFKLHTTLNFFQSFLGMKYEGAAHCDELSYLFKNTATPSIEPDSLEAIGIHVMTTLWTNFAKTGNPNALIDDPNINISWKPYGKNDPNYLEINTKLKMGEAIFKERIEFWDKLYLL